MILTIKTKIINNFKIYLFSYWLLLICIVFLTSCSFLKSNVDVPIISKKEFETSIDNNSFLKSIFDTTADKNLCHYELNAIKYALNEENKNYGGTFDTGRDISNFKGSTLVVGAGKKSGIKKSNQGKCLLVDFNKKFNYLIKEIKQLKDLQKKQNLKKLATRIYKLEEKLELYKKAFTLTNQDILERYFTIDIDETLQPDMVGSITSESDMSQIPDNRFDHVEFENVPCNVFLNPTLYKILERITKPGGTISLSVNNSCRRLIVPIIQQTKFGPSYLKELSQKYVTLLGMHPTYHRINIIVTND